MIRYDNQAALPVANRFVAEYGLESPSDDTTAIVREAEHQDAPVSAWRHLNLGPLYQRRRKTTISF